MQFTDNRILTGRRLLLRPLNHEDFEALYEAASDPRIWRDHPVTDRHKRPQCNDFFESGLKSGMAYVIINKETHQVVGSSRYNNPDSTRGTVEIGWTYPYTETQ